MKMIYKMKNVIQDYAWGSVDAIPDLLGYDNKESLPQAEMWMGSHLRGPSVLIDNKIEKPIENLPFLFKLLSAGSPLSIQVHPDKKRAEQGFNRENDLNIPLDAYNRNYKDNNHKPEIICALTPFWAMCGFRQIDNIIENFQKLDLPVINKFIKELEENRTSSGLKNFFNILMEIEGSYKTDFINQLVKECRRKDDIQYNWVLKLYDKYPDDAGISAPLYLNLVELKPGEALYLTAGELHAYLSGLGLELMATSDNVLRGGLTPKYIDREELKRVVSFSGTDPEILIPQLYKGNVFKYYTPSKEFELSKIILRNNTFKIEKNNLVKILFIKEGNVEFKSEKGNFIKASKGESIFIPAEAGLWTVTGHSVFYSASLAEVE